MKLKRPPAKPMPETIVALIDVVFFLLVFFMMVGRMDATAPFEVTPPYGETGSDMPAGGATVSVAEDGRLALDGLEIAEADLADRLTQMIAADPALLIRVNAHRATELRHVLPLVAEFEALGAAEIVLVVTETEG